MPKKLMKAVKKKQKPCPWPVPKRGKARSNMKAPMKSKQNKKVPYVRHHDKIQPVDRRQSRWGLSVVTVAHMKGRALVRRLRQDGILQKWEHQECPHCAQGALSDLYFDRYKKVWAHRCSKRGCQARVQPHDFHPIFFCGSGSSHTPLGMQAAILCCALANVPVSSVPALLDIHRKPVEKIYSNLEVARARCVQQKERLIVYGAKRTWADVEADEVSGSRQRGAGPPSERWYQSSVGAMGWHGGKGLP